MFRSFLSAVAFAAGVAGVSTGALAYMAAAPAPIPAAFERPMSPAAACAAEAQEQFLSGPVFDGFMAKCTQTAVAHLCDKAAAAKRLTGKKRAAFDRACAAAIAQAEN